MLTTSIIAREPFQALDLPLREFLKAVDLALGERVGVRHAHPSPMQ